MAKEIQFSDSNLSGLDLYARLRDQATAFIWNTDTEAYEAFNPVNVDDYKITLTRDASNEYWSGDRPAAVPAGVVLVTIHQESDDFKVGEGEIGSIDPGALTVSERNSIADTILLRAWNSVDDSGVPEGRNLLNAMRSQRNRVEPDVNGNIIVYKENGTTPAYKLSPVADGNGNLVGFVPVAL